MRVLVDTCVVMDYMQNRIPFCKEAEEVLNLAANEEFTAFITAKSITDINYLVHKCGYHKSEIRGITASLYDFFYVVDTSRVDTFNAVFSSIDDYEDAVMVESAISNNIECIVTRNTKDYINSTVKVYSPSDFLKLFNTKLQICNSPF